MPGEGGQAESLNLRHQARGSSLKSMRSTYLKCEIPKLTEEEEVEPIEKI